MKYSKRILPLLCFLILLTGSLNSVCLIHASGQVRVLNDQGLVDESGAYHILGEVENIGGTSITDVNITATGYGHLGQVLVTSSTYADLTVILPNEKSPFDVILTYVLTEQDVYNYSLSIAYSGANSTPRALKILSNTTNIDSAGILYVDGIITNIGTGVAANVRVIATFFDSEGNVVWANEEYSEPHDILPNTKASFEVLVSDYSVVSLVASYALAAESVQQPITTKSPNFPALPLLIIATIVIVVLLAVIVYIKRAGSRGRTS